MGLAHVTVLLRAVGTRGEGYEADFLVDIGATDSLAPAAELRKIGIQPVGRTSCEFANGAVHEYSFGLVQIEFMSDVTAGRVTMPTRPTRRSSASPRYP